MVALFILAFFGTILGVYGVGIGLAVSRARRDSRHAGVLNRPDGKVLLLEDGGPGRARYHARRQPVFLADAGRLLRVIVEGPEISGLLGFRLQALTVTTSEQLDARLVVDSNKKPALARRLFGNSEVRRALKELCGASATFRAVNLYPGGDLVVDTDPTGNIDDLAERLLRFAEALDAAIPGLEHDDVDLGSTGGSASPTAFSIEIRS